MGVPLYRWMVCNGKSIYKWMAEGTPINQPSMVNQKSWFTKPAPAWWPMVIICRCFRASECRTLSWWNGYPILRNSCQPLRVITLFSALKFLVKTRWKEIHKDAAKGKNAHCEGLQKRRASRTKVVKALETAELDKHNILDYLKDHRSQ